MRIPIKFSGGYEIGRQDFGRPIVLIAAALKVKPEQFREAFSGVTPARDRPPTGAEARKNKEALLLVLKPLGVTNERLDEVSDHYRYQPQRGELWTHTAPDAHAIVENGKVKKIEISNPGARFSSTPTASIPGHESIKLQVKIHLDEDLKKNGSIESIEIAK